MTTVIKTLLDGTGAPFQGQFWDDGSGKLIPMSRRVQDTLTPSNSLSGILANVGSTAEINFDKIQELINASSATIWASWTTPTVGGSGSFPLNAGASFSPPDNSVGKLTILATAAAQAYTVNRYA